MPRTGTAWSCTVHGDIGTNVVVLNEHVYCGNEDCSLEVKLTSKAMQSADYTTDWNRFVPKPTK